MIGRLAKKIIGVYAAGFPFVAITGPRQSGKTTLARTFFSDKPYVSLEDPDAHAHASEDPRGFLAGYPDGAILDEVQRVPEIFSYLQTIGDLAGRMGLFVLTGSQQFGLMSSITQSLAGRVGLVQLLPFSSSELATAGLLPASPEETIVKGMYPPIYDRPLLPEHWHPQYVATYIERDVRQLINVRDLAQFRHFVRLCAAWSGQLLNLSVLANDCGITHNTAKSWLTVLEASYLVHLLHPHHRNYRKRLVKTPKLYFYDTGLACWLLGIHSAEQLALHPLRGALFETWVVSELVKGRFNRGLPSNLHFWRDSTGNEVDVLADLGLKLLPVEIKAGRTVIDNFFGGIRKWTALAGNEAEKGILIYGGGERQRRSDVDVLPWSAVGEVGERL